MFQTEVLIIGGGPAGSACAWQLRKHNIPCIIIDQVPFPRFKPCAGWITPQVVKDLDLNPGEYPYSFTTFTGTQLFIRGFKFKLPSHQHAIRRIEFDHWLLERSCAPFYVHVAKSIQKEKGGYSVDGAFFGKYLVGAGGTYCPVYRTLFKSENPKAREDLIAAQEEEFQYNHADQECYLWFPKNLSGYAWYVPKANGYVNVGIGAWAEKLKDSGSSLKAHWDSLVEKLAQLGLVRDHSYKVSAHTYYLRQRLAQISIDNAYLVGDAVGLATLDLGEGIGPAIRSGMLAADAIAKGADYKLDSISKYSQGTLIGNILRSLY